MRFEYWGRVAIVTGASSGIGRTIALDLAKRGTTVVAVARRKELLEDVAELCRRTAPASESAVVDVADRDAVERMCAGALERHGKVDVLVNNAGIPQRIHATRVTVEDVEEVMRINFLGAVYATLALLPSMVELRDGRIVNIGSVAGRVGSPRESAYSASKYAMTGWSEVLAADLGDTGVKVHLVVPGAIDTEMWQKGQEPASYRGRFVPAQAVSDAVLECLETGKFERWVPRRLQPVSLFRSLAPGAYVKGIARYDRRSGRS